MVPVVGVQVLPLFGLSLLANELKIQVQLI